MNSRQPVRKSIEKEVLVASRRRCCLCVFLNERNEVRKGQIAHLNHNPRDSRFDNLVYLCLEHHDDYDGRPSQSKAFSSQEVREYRDLLYKKNLESIEMLAKEAVRGDAAELVPLSEISQYEIVRRHFTEELDFTLKPWIYSFWQVANEPEFFAYKTHVADGVCLLERIDLPDGRIVIACIETAGNPGTSITNCVEEICFQVCERFDIPAERLVWLEHYDYDEYTDWSLVTFEQRPPNGPFQDPKWIDMTPEIWQSLFLKPKKKLQSWHGHFESKLTKLFDWPSQAI